ncbi:lipocalin-like domain-containing protein [Marinigracilibium pacificum]|uniref:Lipocalin-like domain-containing protein n=1 Tax=Marinigracilibium pacificum TaxID=2729599 RepID=A0A848J0E8_9BACT|nr:lipocalin-like domain-containing protein [Marinigracilibium pacificum]NMM48995.1 lipocalin-like domain-containing protein [Marinigracilibium pacificum]
MEVRDKLIGAWRLVEWVFENEETGEKQHFYGDAPDGLLVFDDSGWMSVQIAKEPRQALNSESFDSGITEELAEAYKTYMGYFGTYEETDPGVLKHTVQNSLFPNWKGDIHIRYASFNNEILTLSTPPTNTNDGPISFKVRWKKQ